VHIIRNSVDHGIELPDERRASGKGENGTITLSARHSGAHVLIEVRDDGKGLDAIRIQEKAVEKGIIPVGTVLTDQEIYSLIFAPGFSTAVKVTSVSGRGVGMDVVKREIDSLGGTVIVNSETGRGTVITLKIPLTLAIIDGLLVRISDEFYVIPLSAVDGCIELIRKSSEERESTREILTYRNEVMPYISLRTLFDVPGAAPAIEQIVVVNAQDSRCGFVVDQVIGDYQTVIKPLGRMYRNTEGLSGATILGDGSVALIVDVNRLAVHAQRLEAKRTAIVGH
jgi:two-component system chemotaxis sensor kinase CheA